MNAFFTSDGSFLELVPFIGMLSEQPAAAGDAAYGGVECGNHVPG